MCHSPRVQQGWRVLAMATQATDSIEKIGGSARSPTRDSSEMPRSKAGSRARVMTTAAPPRMSKAEATKLLTTELTVNPETAGLILGLGRSSAYRAVRSGEIPSIQIGGLYLVSTAMLRKILETGVLPASPNPAPSRDTPSKAAQNAKPTRRPHRRRRA